MVVPVFQCRVSDDGRLVMATDEQARRDAYLRSLAGKPVDVTIKAHRSTRSLQQNAWWWAVAVPMIADSLGYDKHEHDLVHYALVDKCFGTTWSERLHAHVPNVRSSLSTTDQFSELMEWAVRWAAINLSIVIPLPNEVEVPQ